METGDGTTDDTLFDRFRNSFFAGEADEVDEIEAHNAVETTLRRAVRGKLTIECPQDSADRALAVFSRPPRWLIRDAVTDGRQWLAEELKTQEMRSGDIPTPERPTLSVLVLFNGVSELPRVSELETLAEEAN